MFDCECPPPVFPVRYLQDYGNFETEDGRIVLTLGALPGMPPKERHKIGKLIEEKLNR